MKTREITFIGVLTSMALVLSYFERMIPPPVPVPGIKLGLANIIVLIALYILTEKDSFYITIMKIMMVGLLFSGISGMMYGMSGGLLSFAGMLMLKRLKVFSVVGVSIFGGVLHNIGQIIMAAIVVNNVGLLYYAPILIFTGIGCGLLTGIVSFFTLKNIRKVVI